MKKLLALILSCSFLLNAPYALSVTRLYNRSTGDIIDADKDDAEWDNTNAEINTHEAATAAHGATGAVVGTSNTQTLTNKTLTSPTIITSPTAAGATWTDLGTATAFIATSATIVTLGIGTANFSDSNASITGSTGAFIGAPLRAGTYNISIVRATTAAAGDSVKIQGSSAALSSTNPGFFVLNGITAGTLTVFRVTADVTINLTGANWGFGGKGDITGVLLRTFAVNDNGTLRLCVGYLGGRDTVVPGDTTATGTSATAPENMLCNTAVASATNTVFDFGYVRANFDDTGGGSEDLYDIQSGVDDVVTGKTADGLWQPFNTTFGGFSSNPTFTLIRWMQHGLTVCIQTDISANGTSNATTYTMTLPVKANGVSGGLALQPVNNSVNLNPPAGWRTVNDSVTLNIYSTSNDDAWTGSGTKNAEPIGCYEAMP